jgi:hypothetical protein
MERQEQKGAEESLDERIWHNMNRFIEKRAIMSVLHNGYDMKFVDPIDPREGDMYRWQQIIDLGTPRIPGEVWPGEAVQEGVWAIYKEGPWNSNHQLLRDGKFDARGAAWMTIAANVRSFCEKAGSPHSTIDPLDNIDALRDYIAMQQLYTPDLDSKIEELSSQKEEQERIIISLSYRHLMESLQGPLGKGDKYTDNWKWFWEEAFAKAGNNQGHPLFELRKKYANNLKHIRKRGAKLYGTFSTNIHHYLDGKVEPAVGSWNTDDYDIMMALTPEGGLNSDTDWEVVRKKYLIEPEGKYHSQFILYELPMIRQTSLLTSKR